MHKFLSTIRFKWIDAKNFYSNKYNNNRSKGWVLKVDIEDPKELRKLHHDYSLAQDKIEIKKELLSKYQLIISDFYNIPIGTVKKLMPNFFDKEKYVLRYGNLQL